MMFYKGLTLVPCMYINDTKAVRRSLRERLFTLPWKPLLSTKIVKCPILYLLKDDLAYCSYETYARLSKEKDNA